MMRYQSVSPDILPINNGRRPALRTYKEEDAHYGGGGRIPNYSNFEPAKSLKGRSGSGSDNHSANHDHLFTIVTFPSVSPAAAQLDDQPLPPPPSAPASVTPTRTTPTHSHKTQEANGLSHGGIGDVLLQWGQHKRSRRSRMESRLSAAAKAGNGCGARESPPSQARQLSRIQRRSAIAAAEKVAAMAVATMTPPCGSYTRGANLRPCTPLGEATGTLFSNSNYSSHHRNPLHFDE